MPRHLPLCPDLPLKAVGACRRGLEPYTGVGRGQVRAARARRHHLGPAIRPLVRRECRRAAPGVGGFQAKGDITRGAVRAYLAAPSDQLPRTATA